MIPGRRYGLHDLPAMIRRRSGSVLLVFAAVVGIALLAVAAASRLGATGRAEGDGGRAAIALPELQPSPARIAAQSRLDAIQENLAESDRLTQARNDRLESLRRLLENTVPVQTSPEIVALESRIGTLGRTLAADRVELERLQRASLERPVQPPPSPEMQQAEADLAAARAELAELQDRLTLQHPDVLAQQRAVDDLREVVARLAAAAPKPVETRGPSLAEITAVRDRIESSEEEQNRLQRTLTAERRRLASTPRAGQAEVDQITSELQELATARGQLEADASVARRALDDAIARDKEEHRRIEAAAVAAAKAREEEEAPSIWPRLLQVLPWTILAGVVLALAFGGLLEARDVTIRDHEDLAATTDLPQLGTVSEIIPLSRMPSAAERELSTLPEPSSTTLIWHARCPLRTVEQYRQVAHAVRRFRAERQARVIGVTSALPGEGKTLSSVNLAVSLAESYRQRVLLIDADLRRPSVHHRFDMRPSEGLTEWLQSEEAPERAMTRLSSRLSVVFAGTPQVNPVPLLTSLRMAMLIAAARADFDWVIVDTPPAGLITDAGTLESSLDGFIVIVAAGRTPFTLLNQALASLGRERVLGVMLNRMARTRGPENQTYSPLPGR